MAGVTNFKPYWLARSQQYHIVWVVPIQTTICHYGFGLSQPYETDAPRQR